MNPFQFKMWRSWRLGGLISLILMAVTILVVPKLSYREAAFASPQEFSLLAVAQASTGTPKPATASKTNTAAPTMTATSKVITSSTATATATVLKTSTPTTTSTRRPSLTPTRTPSRVVTRVPTAIPTLINPFAGMAYVEWRTGDGLLRMDRPVRWQVEPIERAGPTAYIFFQAGASDVIYQLAVLPVTILQSPESIRSPTNERILREFSAQYDPRSLEEVTISGYTGLSATQIVRRESRQTGQQTEFTLITRVALIDTQLFILMQGLVPSEFETDMQAVLERGQRTLRIDVEGVRAGYSRFLPTLTYTRTPTRRPISATPPVSSTPNNDSALIRSFVEATYTARASASAFPPSATPPIQATVRAVVAATDTANEIATGVAATFAAETSMPPDVARTVEAIVGATRTALAGGVIVAPMITPSFTPTLTPSATLLPSFTPTPAAVLPVPGRLARGNPDAKVTFIEFSDFECPYCGRYHLEVYNRLLAQFGETVRFEYRHFPLESIHPNAYRAALASECAAEQGKFWEMHDKLYANQERLSRASLIIYAIESELGDQARFVRCLDNAQYSNIIDDDYGDGILAGVQGTPTFFILWNGGSEVIVGAQPLSVFVSALERAVAAAR